MKKVVLSVNIYRDFILSSVFTVGCDYMYNETHGNITSPGYPDNYANFLDCTYTITVQDNHYIILTFIYIDVEKIQVYCYDYLQVN